MQTVDTRFETELTKLIDDEVARLTQTLLNNAAITDLAGYKFVIGQIAGLELARYQFGETNRILSER